MKSERHESILCINGFHNHCYVDGCECSCHFHIAPLASHSEARALLLVICREIGSARGTIPVRRIRTIFEKCMKAMPYSNAEIDACLAFLGSQGSGDWTDEDFLSFLERFSKIQTQTLF